MLLFVIYLSLPFLVPIYLLITTWFSTMLMASTPTLLRRNGRFVPKCHLLLHVCYSDQYDFEKDIYTGTLTGSLLSLQPSTAELALFSIFQTPGGVGLPDRECLPVSLSTSLDVTFSYHSITSFTYSLLVCMLLLCLYYKLCIFQKSKWVFFLDK